MKNIALFALALMASSCLAADPAVATLIDTLDFLNEARQLTTHQDTQQPTGGRSAVLRSSIHPGHATTHDDALWFEYDHAAGSLTAWLDIGAIVQAANAPGARGPGGGKGKGGQGGGLRWFEHLYPQSHPKTWMGAGAGVLFLIGERENWWDLVQWSWIDSSGGRRTTGNVDDFVARDADGTVVPQVNIINSDYVDLDIPSTTVLNIINSTHIDVQRDDPEPDDPDEEKKK